MFVWVAIVFSGYANQHKGETAGKRIRLALQSLGPVFIKFGQMLSTRRDLLPEEIADELAYLQDKVEPFDPQQAEAIIKRALGIQQLSQLFSEFDRQPLASASIAQVHSARLRQDNKAVIVKVLRPDLNETIDADIDLLLTFAQLMQKVVTRR